MSAACLNSELTFSVSGEIYIPFNFTNVDIFTIVSTEI